MNSLHFKKRGLLNSSLTSICDFCRQREQEPAAYANETIAIFAHSLLLNYEGKTAAAKADYLIKNKDERKNYEGLIQDYDGNELAQQQLQRSAFNQAVIASETGKIAFKPAASLDFAENLRGLGLKVDFQLNEVDFIDRERVRAKYNYRCQYCGRRGRSVDHKDPVSLSHNNDFDNLTLSCSECNRIKSNMPFALFKKLNDAIPEVNQKLVQYENILTSLKHEFTEKKRLLAAKVHLKGVINDPELNAMRKQNKRLQDAIDSLDSDYQNLRQVREEYFATGWRLDQEKQHPEII